MIFMLLTKVQTWAVLGVGVVVGVPLALVVARVRDWRRERRNR